MFTLSGENAYQTLSMPKEAAQGWLVTPGVKAAFRGEADAAIPRSVTDAFTNAKAATETHTENAPLFL
jgi:hypothetical protein